MDHLEAIEVLGRWRARDSVCVEDGGVVAIDKIEVRGKRRHIGCSQERRA
jgi:hypothetical protein